VFVVGVIKADTVEFGWVGVGVATCVKSYWVGFTVAGTKNLEVSSVQNKHKAKTRSQGASLGIGSSGVNSVGFNQSKADENSKTVLLTSMTTCVKSYWVGFTVAGGVKAAGT
jgi:hypothetical protein